MILVTGAGGFLGRHLVAHLLAGGADVVPLYRSVKMKIGKQRWEADLTNPEQILGLKEYAQTPHTVVHLAGRVEISLAPNPASASLPPVPGFEDVSSIYSANVVSTAHVLQYCLQKGVGHLIFASSQTVYGMPACEVITEETPCEPLEHYAASKLCGERLLKIGARQGLAVTVLRFPGLYGGDRKEGVVYGFCKSALEKRKIEVKADIPLPIDVIHVSDVVDSMEKAISSNGYQWRCLNIATGEACSLNILADSIAELVPGCAVHVSGVPQPIVRMDSSQARLVLGWQAVPRRERLSAMIENVHNEFRVPEHKEAWHA